jgi:hypothetical protein
VLDPGEPDRFAGEDHRLLAAALAAAGVKPPFELLTADINQQVDGFASDLFRRDDQTVQLGMDDVFGIADQGQEPVVLANNPPGNRSLAHLTAHGAIAPNNQVKRQTLLRAPTYSNPALSQPFTHNRRWGERLSGRRATSHDDSTETKQNHNRAIHTCTAAKNQRLARLIRQGGT